MCFPLVQSGSSCNDVCFVHAAQEVLESLKDRWFQADTNPNDQLLNEMEFLSFLHPEHSRGMLKYMVREIVRDLGMCPTTISQSTVIPTEPTAVAEINEWANVHALLFQTRTAIRS